MKNEPSNRAALPLARLLATAILLIAPGCGGSRRYSPASAAERREQMEQRIADVLAEQSLRAAGRPARAAVVRAAPETNFGDEHARLAARLAETLRDDGVEVTEWTLPAKPQTDVNYAPEPVPLTGSWLADRQRATPGGTEVVISLAGAPVGSPEHVPRGLPPLVCLAAVSGENIAPMMRADVIRAAIVPRRTPVPEGEKDWFDIRFTITDRDTLAAWEQPPAP